jgi:predicted phage terminase large subunit-like protein
LATHKTPPSMEEIKTRGRFDYGFFVETFFPEMLWGKPSPMHRFIFDLESETQDCRDRKDQGRNVSLAAPRGNAKTTLGVIIKAIHAICYDYEDFILVIAYSKAEATDKIKDIRDELKYNEKLREVFGDLVPGSAGKTGFVCANGRKTRLLSRSKGGQVRGLRHGKSRPTLVLLDDIEDNVAVKSPDQRKKTKEWFMKDVMGSLQTDKSSDVRLYGTVLHQQALLVEILNNPAWIRRRFSAIIKWATRSDLWQEWEAIYTDLEKQDSAKAARAFYEANRAAMDEGVEVLWPDGEPYYNLMLYKIAFGLASLYSEKLNDPYDPDAQILHPDKCKRFRILYPWMLEWPQELKKMGIVRGFCIQWVDMPERMIHSDELETVAFWDPALAESKKSDYAAISVCAQDTAGYIYNLETWMEKAVYTRQIQKAFEVCERWQVPRLFLEAVAFQKLLYVPFEDEKKRRQEEGEFSNVDCFPVKQHKKKEWRIGRLEGYINNLWLLFPDIGLWLAPLFEQMTVFPTGEHDDGPDALEGAINKLRRPGGTLETEGGDDIMSAV